MKNRDKPVRVLILALPETAGSALYGMLDVLLATGNVWESLVGRDEPVQRFAVSIVSLSSQAFSCGHGIPVIPACSIADSPDAELLIIPEIWLGPDESLREDYQAVYAWLREKYRQGLHIYSACSGAVLLAESGLLDGCEATSHWAYQDMFRRRYPQVAFRAESTLVFGDAAGRIVTAGGTTSWHDLALHIIARHAGPAEALRIAKVYLLKLHDEGQLPYSSLLRRIPHNDAAVRHCEEWLQENFHDPRALPHLLATNGVPERSLKRRFRNATGCSLLEYLQRVRVEESKRLLERGELSIEAVSLTVGYEDFAFFRRLFKRLTGLKPSEYRRMFRLA